MRALSDKVDVADLKIGMFVSQLDRPWLETPFLFQGFYINTREEIQELNNYCRYVYIDIEQSSGSIRHQYAQAPVLVAKWRKARHPGKSGFFLFRKLARWFGRDRLDVVVQPGPGEFYQDTVEVKEELGTARKIHESALDKMVAILDGIRRGEEIRIPELEAVAGSMVDSVLRNSTALVLLVRMRNNDDYLYAHSIATAVWALVLGRHLGLDKDSLQALGLGGLLMDVGKTRLPRELLGKKGKLTSEELAYARTHIELGLEMLKEQEGTDPRALEMLTTHHERHDGSGYPKGLKGHQIPVFGRIGGLVDTYAAMTSDRPYAMAESSYNVMREIRALSGSAFQPEMVEQFIQAVGIFPAGSLVELNTGEVGVVIKEHRFHRLRPQIIIILDAGKNLLAELKVVDLNDLGSNCDGPPEVWIESGVEPGTYDIDPSEYFL